MSSTRHFPTFTDARDHFRAVLDSARSGMVTTVTRDAERYVVVPAATQRAELARLVPANAQVVPEGGGWAVILPGLPVHGDAETFDGAIADVIVALREYAADWNDHLHLAPNHAVHRPVVELVELSDDAQLMAWLVTGAPGASEAASTRLQLA